jgi:hypothetical protein
LSVAGNALVGDDAHGWVLADDGATQVGDLDGDLAGAFFWGGLRECKCPGGGCCREGADEASSRPMSHECFMVEDVVGCRQCFVGLGRGWGTADPSTALRSVRDDKSEGGAFSRDWIVAEKNSRSLHFATLRSG